MNTLTIDTESDPGAWQDAMLFREIMDPVANSIALNLHRRALSRPANSARSIKAARTRKRSPG